MVLLSARLILLQDFTLLNDRTVNDYTDHVRRKLAGDADVSLIVDKEVRAGTLPGGHVYLSTGLFVRAQNEGELAGAMAHEIAHAGTDCIRFIHTHTRRKTGLSRSCNSRPPTAR